MAELTEVTACLDKLREFPPWHRLLLTTTGTLQGALSAYFGREVTVEVISQAKTSKVLIDRTVVMKAGDLVVCKATSTLNIKRADILEGVMTKRIGIGQLLQTLGVHPKFELLNVGQDANSFWREYQLKAKGVTYQITEEFPLALYS